MGIEQDKQEASELLRAIRRGDASALERLVRQQRRWAETDAELARQQIALDDARYAVAREHWAVGWTALCGIAPRHTLLFELDAKWMHERVHGLLRTRVSAPSLEQIRLWHPAFATSTDAEILAAPFADADAQLVYAREHGCETWVELRGRLAAFAAAPPEPFRAAFLALKALDIAAFSDCLRRDPELARERGTNGNTLLNLAVSLVAKAERGVALALVEALLAGGADVNGANNRGWTPLHQAAYSNQCDVAARLVDAGGELEAEAHGAGGTPLMAALFWGHREVAELLSRHSLAPANLRVAAAMGHYELLAECLGSDGALSPQASAARGFYRPHSGFPDWQPTPARQEVLDEALVWAAKCGRTEAMPRLLAAGARLDADPYRGTALMWAAVCDRIEAAQWLLEHGANVNQQATFGGLTHGQGITALHMAAQNGRLAMAQLLVARGADVTIREQLYNSDAAGAAKFFGHPEVADYLRGLA